LARAVQAFQRPGLAVNSTALLVNWPAKASRTLEGITHNSSLRDEIDKTGIFSEIENM